MINNKSFYPVIRYFGICYFGVCSMLFYTTVAAFGNITSSMAVTGGSRLNSGQSYALSIAVPVNIVIQPDVALPTQSIKALFVDFDARDIPVHELPPLPLTLDAPE